MEFRRINGMPPYVFTIIDGLKIEARRAGQDVIDLGFGNPDIPSPEIAVDKLCEAARNTRNHRYSASRGIPKLREAVAGLYERRFGVELDPDTEVISTIGAKEGFSHLMWVLLGPGDTCMVPSPSYPIHIWGPLFAGAAVREVPMTTAANDEGQLLERIQYVFEHSWPRPKVIVCSFPHNPTTACVELDFFQELVDFARANDVIVVHDNAYAELGFDGWDPPSILQAEGAKECAVELYSMTKSFSMAGWRMAFLAGNREVVQALAKLKSYLDYGAFQPIQIATTVTLNEAVDFPARWGRSTRPGATRSVTASIAWAGTCAGRRARCSRGPPSRSPTARWARSSSHRCWCARRRSPRRRASASVPMATASCASLSSRTSSASRRACAT